VPETRVLVVDDEAPLREFVRRNLEVRGYRVRTASNGLEALAAFGAQPFDLVILDLMMPHLDGLETARRIRERSLVPIVILTALGEEQDKVRAFEIGADDYLTKPFGVEELLARVKAVLRRSVWSEMAPASQPARLSRRGILVDLETHQVSLNGNPVDLTPIEFSLLYYLMLETGKVIAPRSLLQRVWGPEYLDEVEYVRVYVGRLRKKLESPEGPNELIETVRGVGYRFVPD
jgi:two-component system KDP operon response regulator KdpE